MRYIGGEKKRGENNNYDNRSDRKEYLFFKINFFHRLLPHLMLETYAQQWLF